MPVTYTNHKGVTYYLCETKRGKARYYFGRQPKGEPIEEIPAGYEIRESPNGVVSLAKARRYKSLPSEIEAVKEAIKKHPTPDRFRIDVKPDRIIVYELVQMDRAQQANLIAEKGETFDKAFAKRMKKRQRRFVRYTAMIQFILQKDGEEDRLFEAYKRSYGNDEQEWWRLDSDQSIEKLADEFIPKLGGNKFYGFY